MNTKFTCCLEVLSKTASEYHPTEEEWDDGPPPKRWQQVAKVIGSGLLGMGGGYVAGAGVGKLLERAVDRAGGNSANVARKVMPIAGSALGILYPMWKAREQQEIRDALASTRDETDRGLPGQ